MRWRSLLKLALIVPCTWMPATGLAAAQPSQIPQKIAYDTCYAWDYQVYCDIVVRADGSITRVVSGGVQPKWSPDGNRIAFVSGTPDVATDIFLVSLADPTIITAVTNAPGVSGHPEWSRDGTRIAFVSNRSGAGELYVTNADGTGLVQLTNGIGFSGRYAWSPDGKVIALTVYGTSGWELYMIHADGSNLMRLTGSNGPSERLSWSPDGSRIVFDCAGEVCAINADGTGLVALTTGSGMGGVLAPIGGSLAFSTARFGNGYEVAVSRSDGTIVRVAPDTGGIGWVWSPDAQSLLFQSTEIVGYSGICYFGGGAHNADDFCVPMTGIYAVNADGTGLRLLDYGGNPDFFVPRAGQPVASFTPVCNGSSCVFDASGSVDPENAIVSYEWTFGDGSSGTGPTPSHVYATGATYDVTLTIVDGESLHSSTSLRVVANAVPVASFTVVCNGYTCSFDGSASADPDGTLVSSEWQFGDGYTSTGKTATHAYATGTFVARLTVQDNAGARSTVTTTLQIVNAPPVASFTTACNGFMCTFNASASRDPDGTIRDYLWHFGDGNWEYSTAITSHQYFAAGTYVVSFMVADDTGQWATHNETITVVPGAMHIGDLDGSSRRIDPKRWEIGATVTVHDAKHGPLANATVTALLSSGEIPWCTTDAVGKCQVIVALPASQLTNVLITIQSVTHLGFVYQPASNHDPEGDSNGTTIRVRK